MSVFRRPFFWFIVGIVVIVVGAIGYSQIGGGADQLTQIVSEDWSKGPQDAPVTIVEYGDFQCPACASYSALMQSVHEEFPDEVQIVFRHFPLQQHQHARIAAFAAEAAGQQERFFEMHDMLFERQRSWSGAVDPRELFISYGEELGLNRDTFIKDMDARSSRQKVDKDFQGGTALGVNSTPTFFLNGEKIKNPSGSEEFSLLIRAALINVAVSVDSSEGEEVHEHADLKMYINGNSIDFTQEKYQSSEENPRHEYTHLHDGNGDVLHKHFSAVTLGDFFESIGMSLSSSCLTVDTGEEYCTNGQSSLKFFVNGEARGSLHTYSIQDLDQVLISYGSPHEDVTAQIASVSDDSCIYSEVCPERGTPPEESCVGGLGTSCGTDHPHDE
ncbi:MAG: thioredoxin domain-containing protein [Candidatus Magasanikbacteria bacterium]|jgi:predicted DsbA family dithiol-disulfide isomerase|nr:thioredoxin domain-containing protein [Candidatus Magasanikbacteria bacterium]MBT4220723.1 thioredoxin domain-containing protein [Candidatus Magasanikbacteria bacterium]MBT4350068.1 thioredoxin domain-containing protein [Candidatus Magasanikbacteria bacterium]MBT4541489.1 thioredoxin domain-containing protein [Candidatus Magasanikbacteria bacterium]MBT6253017.1 thioredoxin domain-containing protein [Candidatus Magasanikbacteria bacterium]